MAEGSWLEQTTPTKFPEEVSEDVAPRKSRKTVARAIPCVRRRARPGHERRRAQQCVKYRWETGCKSAELFGRHNAAITGPEGKKLGKFRRKWLEILVWSGDGVGASGANR